MKSYAKATSAPKRKARNKKMPRNKARTGRQKKAVADSIVKRFKKGYKR